MREARVDAVDERGDRLRLVAGGLCNRAFSSNGLGSRARFASELQRKHAFPYLSRRSPPSRYSHCESIPVSPNASSASSPRPQLAVTARAAQLKAEGKDIIGLGAGEPDFDTPEHIADAGIEAIRKGFTRYTNVDGIVELKDAIIAKFRRDNGLDYERNQILVSTGAKQTIYNLCCAVLDPGDEAVIPAPYWVSLPGHGAARRRPARHAVCRREHGLQDHAAPARSRDHAEDAAVHIEQPEQPDRRRLHARRAARARRSARSKHPQVVIGTDDMYENIWWGREPFVSSRDRVPGAL